MRSLAVGARRYRLLLRQVTALDRMNVGFLLFLVVAGTGALFRFLDIGLIRHLYDYSYPAYEALLMLEQKRLLLTGQPSSVFLDNPPLMGYIQAIPLLLWRSPYAVYLFIIVLNTFALWFLYRVTFRLLGRKVALVATLLFAINPWVVFFSRTAWVQSLLPFFVALITWGLWSLAHENRSGSRFLLSMVAVTVVTQSYIQAMALVAQVGASLLLLYRRVPRRPFYAGMALFLGALLLYGYGISQEWEHNAAQLLQFGGSERTLTREASDHAIRLVTGWNFDITHAGVEDANPGLRHTLSQTAHHLLLAALLAGITRAFFALRAPGIERRTATLLLLWFGIPLLLMSYTAHPIHPHYLLLGVPAGHVLAAWAITPLLNYRGLREVTLAGFLFLTILFGYNLHRANQEVAKAPGGPDFRRWALEDGARAGATVRDLVAGQQPPLRVVAPGHPALLSSLSGRYLTYLEGIDYPDFIVVPGSEPLLYLLANKKADDGLDAVQERLPERRVELADGTTATFLRMMPHDGAAAIQLPAVPLHWNSDADLSLLGYTLEGEHRPGGALELIAYWRVESVPPIQEPIRPAAFYQLLDQSEAKVAAVDGRGQWSYRWRAGDIYRERVEIPIPAGTVPGRYQLLIGLYDPVHQENYYLHSPDGPLYALSVPIEIDKGAAGE